MNYIRHKARKALVAKRIQEKILKIVVMKARVQCSFHHPYRGKQTTVFAAGNKNY